MRAPAPFDRGDLVRSSSLSLSLSSIVKRDNRYSHVRAAYTHIYIHVHTYNKGTSARRTEKADSFVIFNKGLFIADLGYGV